MTAQRRLAMTIGVFYLVTFLTSIPALALKRSFLQGEGSPAALPWAVVLEILLAVACVGTAVAFFPIGSRSHPAFSLGFVASRTLEASTILVGVIALLSVDAIRGSMPPGDIGGAEAALIAVHDWAFLIGPGLLPALNAMLFGAVLYRTRLVPRIIPLIGLIGAPLLLASALGTILGLNDQVSLLSGVAALPIACWEFGIGVWLIFKGFAPTPSRPSTQGSAR